MVFLIIPIGLAFALAFTDARLISPRPGEFVGFDNFVYLFTDPVFWASVRNTLYFAVVVVPVQAGFALVLALLVNAKVRGTNFFRTVYFLPVVTSMVVVSLLWRFMYQKDGLINELLSAITFGSYTAIDWLNDPVYGHARDHGHVDLAGRRLPHGDLAGGAADHPRRAVRGSRDRRRQPAGSSSATSPGRACGRPEPSS